MKHKRIFMAFLAAVMLFVLTGCQLAREDTGDIANKDRLIGVFITAKYLDLFDMDSYLNDHTGKISGSGEIAVNETDSRYQGRLYATLKSRTMPNGENGETIDIKEYIFENIDGIAYFSATVPAAEKENNFIAQGSDEGITDGHVSLFYGDDEDKTTLEGTIYLSQENGNGTHYINPVYQSADMRVYSTAGSGIILDDIQSEGPVYTQTLEGTETVTENGNTKTVSISIKISLAIMFPPEQIAVLQMNADSSVLIRTEYEPGKLPAKLTPEQGVEYIIIETRKHDGMEKAVVSRLLYGKSDQTLGTFFCREDGVCIKQWTQLAWQND